PLLIAFNCVSETLPIRRGENENGSRMRRYGRCGFERGRLFGRSERKERECADQCELGSGKDRCRGTRGSGYLQGQKGSGTANSWYPVRQQGVYDGSTSGRGN